MMAAGGVGDIVTEAEKANTRVEDTIARPLLT
jgi:hypothetical protein